MSLAVVEPFKTCPRCHESKPWSDYYPRTRWEDGTTRTVAAYCRPCHAAKRSESYARNPGSKAAANRAYRERMKSDPVRLADHCEKQRIYNRMWYLRRGRNVGKHTRNETCPMLPTVPFVAWLRTLGDTPTQISLVSGLHPQQVGGYLRGRYDTVSLDVVDRACLHADVPLDDLYPLQLDHAA